ncbi:MAG: ABC transporter permease [Exiguobacterium sp.]|jgi:D-methionine transport system permease protein|uniref:Binding-protein-dependent transport systems inner membrane component n=3 Tax=Exiguobacterium TaxID=33986 RepID=C4L251_EXISA|nr:MULTISPECIES: methionine ABC transporter permease [Exiguobacterium]MBR2758534.1 ABC transporter permease [Exiguobacterium sp.]QPI69049.1 ABC transporter permease [Exiguobacterium sp. PBE]ACQ69225.1 binding-protein-dependent transport systems inner membrane component [Exiguobacterium sp. AT1b]MBR3063433.1 ABC transporter permease [Exiguobacterium sp.]MBR3217305.1 ABC transporter permease [Exiguobacterium sp.]
MQQFWTDWGDLIWTGTVQTLTMTSIALLISTLIGLPLGTLLVLTRPNGRLANRFVYGGLSSVINVIRSIPFIILLFFILPFTRFIMGTTIGVQGVLLPLIVFTAPYIARLMESALLEVDRGVIEAYEAMGISTRKIIWYVLIREARSSIVLGLTIATIGLIGATAMAGLVGAGGLGDIAYQYGHLRFEPEVMYVTIFVLILLVQSIQSFGNRLAAKLKKA